MKFKKLITAVTCLCMTAQMCGYIQPVFNASADNTIVEQPVQTEFYDIYMYKNLGRYIQITSVATNASGKIEVPSEIAGLPVQIIGEHAFAGNANVTEIVLPDTVKTIDKQAFYQCTALEKVNIPDGVTSIPDETFINCKSLKEIRLPEKITSIGTRAFYGCSSLQAINIPDSVKRIKEQAFHDCSGLTEIHIPDGVTSIEANTFNGCNNISYISLPESVATVGMNAFPSKLVQVTINNPDCELHDFAVNFTNTTIKSHAESKVQEFATEHGIKFRGINNISDERKLDVNADDDFNVADVVALNNWLKGRGSIDVEMGDVNHDGYVDIFDLCLMKQLLLVDFEINPPIPASLVNLTADIQSAEVQGKEADDEFISGQTEFALELFQNTIKEDENVLVSPYSVMQALAMTGNGADGSTRTEMKETLGNIDFDTLNQYLYTLRTNQPNTDKCKLLTANSVWSRDNEDIINVKSDFLQKVVDYYNAEVYKAPFDDTTVKDINNWVDKNTDHMINQVIDNIDDETVMYLINAVTFDAKWKTPYTEHEYPVTHTFTAYDGTKQTADMMYSDEYYYLEDENAIGFMKYYEGGRYAFATLLPNEDTSVVEYVEGLTPESLHNILANPQKEKVDTGMPKFSYDYSTELQEVLASMGMPTAFTMFADFSKLAQTATGQFFINRVLHKTFIEVNTEGTRAAAVTVIQDVCGCAPMPVEKKEVILDRPFVYCIVDTETSLPVFMGTLMSLE